jgi:hypothetical protein
MKFGRHQNGWTEERDSRVYLSVRADFTAPGASLCESIIGVFRMNSVPGIIPFTNRRATLAIGVAILADLIQLPINLSFFAAAASGVGLVAADIPLEALDTAIDFATAFIVNSLLGFHWTLLPTCALEMVPGVDALPTWTACVAYVAWRRKTEQRSLPTS